MSNAYSSDAGTASLDLGPPGAFSSQPVTADRSEFAQTKEPQGILRSNLIGECAGGRRYLALWFPFLPADRLRRHAGHDGSALVFTASVKGAMRLAAVSPEALAAGLSPHMTLADAQALLPTLHAVPSRPDLDDAFLARLRDDLERFTPLLAIDAPHGLALDMTGCAHLSGGEAPMAARVRQRCRAAGLQVHCALAGTPQAARALARFAIAARDAPLIVPAGQDRAFTARLSVAALELPDQQEAILRRAGLKRLADIIDRSSSSLAARLGRDFPARLARITGAEDTRITPERPPSPCIIDRILPEPVALQTHIEALLANMLLAASQRLEREGLGGLRFTTQFYRTDGVKRAITVATSQPTRDPALVNLLLRERLNALDDPLDPGFGFDQIRLSVCETAPYNAAQSGLGADISPANNLTDASHAHLARLADRLTARLGAQAVLRLRPRGSHLPEQAALLAPNRLSAAHPAPPEADWRRFAAGDPPVRPLHLFCPPQQVEALDETSDGAPQRFRWRRVIHDVAAAEGPERLSPEWWLTLPTATPPAALPLALPEQIEMNLADIPSTQDAAHAPCDRDYYRIEDQAGRRFWLFRRAAQRARAPQWFIHGLFA